MTVKLDLEPEIEADLLAQAEQNGLTLEAYLARVLAERAGTASAQPLTRSQIAGKRIRELRKGLTLGGISTKELIEEGRV